MAIYLLFVISIYVGLGNILEWVSVCTVLIHRLGIYVGPV